MIKIIKQFKKSTLNEYSKVEINILYSNNHNKISLKINDKISNNEIDIMLLIEIENYTKELFKNFKENYNNVSLIFNNAKNKISEVLMFDFNYYITSNNDLFINLFDTKKDFENTIEIAKDAILKSDIINLTSNIKDKCNLYISIDKGQLVTDIEPNNIINKDNYLPLCSLTKEEREINNLNEHLLNKVEENYY